MKKLKDLPGKIFEFVLENKPIVIGITAGLILLIIFIFSLKNYYCSILFYPDKTKTSLIYEKRYIIYGKNRLDKINKVVDELLLGPVSPDIDDIFPIKSKLLSSRMDKDTLSLNLTRETVMDVSWEKNNNVSIYKILLQSIVDTVCYHDRNIKKVKFYFDSKEFKYIGDFGPIDQGVSPDWESLKR